MKPIWLLDPGHGVDTKGKRSPSMPREYIEFYEPDSPGVYEWEFNRDMADLIMTAAPMNMDVFNIVPENVAVPLAARCKRANSYLVEGDPVLLSLHSNAAGNGGWNPARGVVGFVAKKHSDKEEWLARALAGEICAASGIPLRRGGFATANFTMLTRTRMPSVLLEIGFMTNMQDMEILAGEHADSNRNAIAQAIVGVMQEYEEIYYGKA